MDELDKKAEHVLGLLRARSLMLGTAESCTGGLIAETLTRIPGSSESFWGGVVTYDNRAKIALLGVSQADLSSHGAVSAEVAEAMARGFLDRYGTDLAVAVTGIAGPGGGSPQKPVGTVYVSVAGGGAGPEVRLYNFSGDRLAIRYATVTHALDLLERRLRY